MPLLKCIASKARPKNGIAYVTDEKKAKIVTVRNLFEDEDYAKQFDETANRFCKTLIRRSAKSAFSRPIWGWIK